jgi:hypothetical protein
VVFETSIGTEAEVHIQSAILKARFEAGSASCGFDNPEVKLLAEGTRIP